MITQLTVTRFIGILLIVIFHFGQSAYPFNSSFVFHTVSNFGNAAVGYFFVLSGFIMTISYYNKQPIDYKKFLLSRFARIYPVYFISLIFYIISSHTPISYHQGFYQFAANIFLLQSWIPSFPLSLNSPNWFLSILVFFYLLFPYILSYMINMENKKRFLFVLIIWLLSFVIFIVLHKKFYRGFPSNIHDLIFYNPLMHLNAFIVGIWGGIYFKNRNHLKCDPFLSITSFLSSLVLIFIIFALNLTPYSCYHNGLLAPIFLVLILSLSLDKTIFSSFLSKKPFVILGHLSYSMYLLQYPLIIVMNNLDSQNKIANTTQFFYIYLLILISSSFLIYYLFERPLGNLIALKSKEI